MDIKFDISEESSEINSDNIGKELQKIVNSVHTDPEKRIVNQNYKGYEIACPYCGDSASKSNVKRGKIYLETSTYKCWNGGCFAFKSLKQFFKDFNSDAHLYVKEFNLDQFVDSSKSKISISDLYDIKDQHVEREKLMKLMKLTEIKNNYASSKYLEGRKQDIFDRRMAVEEWSGNIIFFNMSKNENVIGIQKRIMKPTKSRFISYDYADMMTKIVKEEFDQEAADDIHRISLIYNILRVDFSKDINVFESSLNSHHFKNSMACWGSNSMMYIKNAWYFMDDDVAGRKSALKVLDKGLKVFLWSKMKREFPYYEKCGDINDIFKKGIKNGEKLKEFFSNDKLDTIYL